VVLLVGRERIGAVCRRGLRGANCAAVIVRRDLCCVMYAARICAARTDAARLNSNVGLNSNGVRGAVAVNRH
jgi:hypothetical protein